MPVKVLLAGGGTGGHVYPALAMGDALRARGYELHYYGDAGRLEGRVAAERGYPFHPVQAVAFPRAGIMGKIRFLFGLLRSVALARTQVKADAPALVLGVGGYVMAPTVLAAWTLGIPCVIHEANVAPGLANRLCARVSKLVLLTYDETRQKLAGAEMVTVGCPVNPKILQGDRHKAAERYGLDPSRPTLLVVGGSLGAATLNTLALACARDPDRRYQLLHICGPRYHDELKKSYGELPEGVVLVGYEDRMGDAYALADLVVCRAGSSTLAELAALGKASMLIPSPNVTDNHQEHNARGLEQVGAAVVVLEKGLETSKVVESLRVLLGEPESLKKMSDAAKSLAKLDVAEQVAQLLVSRFLPPP